MVGLDTNILVQLASVDHPSHLSTVAILDDQAASGMRAVFPALVITEFLHVVTDPRRFSPPFKMSEAVSWIESLLQDPAFMLIDTPRESVAKALDWMRLHRLGRKRILDTQLAAIFHSMGITRLLTSDPRDFEIFGVFEIVAPTSGPPLI